jgi:hypothetical protein
MGMVQYTDKEMRMFHDDGKMDHASRGWVIPSYPLIIWWHKVVAIAL